LTLKGKINSVRRHPSILKDVIQGKNSEEIRAKVKSLDEVRAERLREKEALKYISYLKKNLPYYIKNPNDKLGLNKLCCIEDWENREIREVLSEFSELQKTSSSSELFRKDWQLGLSISRIGQQFIHRKDWEWAMSVVAMCRLGKLNKNNTAIGVGCGKEVILFYLANKLNHIYATDLYTGDEDWKSFAPADFPDNPKKYAPFPYKEEALTVLRMDGTKKLQFASDSFDIAFSFSSIEHFGGENHSGALRSLREIERVLKQGGIATITTEYIINDKKHPDLTNQFFDRQTIYSDLIDKLDHLQLVEEPLDLRITTNTLDTVMDVQDAFNWDTNKFDDEYKKTHPYILLRLRDILVTSVMLVFQKQ
jgi:SAM-dependent methyltransferase